MPSHARRDIVRNGEIAVYHTWSRCVQRAWLCGEDPLTGFDYNHRREWIESLLEHQASLLAVDVGGFHLLGSLVDAGGALAELAAAIGPTSSGGDPNG